MNIQEQIFKAIDTITQQKIDSLEFDRLVEGIIQSDIQEDGSYKFSFNGATYSAYPLSNTVKFKTGDMVYIMAIGGDFSKRKIIISTKTGPGGEMIDIKEELEKLNIYGKNYVTTDTSEGITLNTNGDLVTYDLTLNPNFINDGLAQTDIRISADIKSNLKDLDYPSGIGFGVELLVDYKDENDNVITKKYDLNMREMVGNIYELSFGKQSNVADLEMEYIATGVKRVQLYVNKFSSGGYVTFKNVKIEYIQEILADVIKDQPYSLNIHSSNGDIFKNGAISTTLSVSAFRGQYDVTQQIDDIQFNWSRKSASFNPEDEKWRKFGKELEITGADVKDKATFTCDLVSASNSAVLASTQITLADLHDTTTLQGYLDTNFPKMQLLKSNGAYIPDWYVQDKRSLNEGLLITASLFKMGSDEDLLYGSSVPTNINIIWKVNISSEVDDNGNAIGYRELTEEDALKYGIAKTRPGTSKSIRVTKNLMNEGNPSFSVRAIFIYRTEDNGKEELFSDADFGLSIQGMDGEKGSGYTVISTNENHQIVANLNGQIVDGEIGENGRATSNIEVYFEDNKMQAESPTQTGVPTKGHFQVRPQRTVNAVVAVSPFDYSKIYVQSLSADRADVNIKVCISDMCSGDANVCSCPMKRFSLVKTTLGATWLDLDSYSVIVNEEGELTPTTLRVAGKQRTYDGITKNTTCRFNIFGSMDGLNVTDRLYASKAPEESFEFGVTNEMFESYKALKVVMLTNSTDESKAAEIDSQFVHFIKDGVSSLKVELWTPLGRVFKNRYQDNAVTVLPIETLVVSGITDVRKRVTNYQWYYQDITVGGWTPIHDYNGYVAPHYSFSVDSPWKIEVGMDAVNGNETIKCVIQYGGEYYESIVDITDYTDPYVIQIQATDHAFKNGNGRSTLNCSVRQNEKEIDPAGDKFIYIWEKHKNGNKVYGYIPRPMADSTNLLKHKIEYDYVPVLYKTTQAQSQIEIVHPNIQDVMSKVVEIGMHLVLEGQDEVNYVTGIIGTNKLELLKPVGSIGGISKEMFYGNFKIIEVLASEVLESNTFYCNVISLTEEEVIEENEITTSVVDDAIVDDAIVDNR